MEMSINSKPLEDKKQKISLKLLAKGNKRKLTLLALLLIFISSLFIFSKFEELSRISLNQTNITTTTTITSQENVSLPEGVVGIGREGRIKIV